MKVELELPEFKGYRYTGEYSCPKANQYYLDNESLPSLAYYNMPNCRPIMEKLPEFPTWLLPAPIAGIYKNGNGNWYICKDIERCDIYCAIERFLPSFPQNVPSETFIKNPNYKG